MITAKNSEQSSRADDKVAQHVQVEANPLIPTRRCKRERVILVRVLLERVHKALSGTHRHNRRLPCSSIVKYDPENRNERAKGVNDTRMKC